MEYAGRGWGWGDGSLGGRKYGEGLEGVGEGIVTGRHTELG